MTSRSNLTLLPGEPKAGSAALSTVIFASLVRTLAMELAVTLSPCSGWPVTSTRLVRLVLPVIGPSMLARIWSCLLSPWAMAPMSGQSTFCPWLTPAGEEEI